MDYNKICKALRKQACESYPAGCRSCGATRHCGSKVEHRAAEAIEALLYQHQLDLAEIVSMRRQIEALEEE